MCALDDQRVNSRQLAPPRALRNLDLERQHQRQQQLIDEAHGRAVDRVDRDRLAAEHGPEHHPRPLAHEPAGREIGHHEADGRPDVPRKPRPIEGEWIEARPGCGATRAGRDDDEFGESGGRDHHGRRRLRAGKAPDDHGDAGELDELDDALNVIGECVRAGGVQGCDVQSAQRLKPQRRTHAGDDGVRRGRTDLRQVKSAADVHPAEHEHHGCNDRRYDVQSQIDRHLEGLARARLVAGAARDHHLVGRRGHQTKIRQAQIRGQRGQGDPLTVPLEAPCTDQQGHEHDGIGGLDEAGKRLP